MLEREFIVSRLLHLFKKKMFPLNSLSFVVLLIASIISFLLISFSFLSSFIFFLFYFLIINKYLIMKLFWFRWCGKLNLFVSSYTSYIVRTAEPRLGQALDSGLGWNFWNSTNFQNFLFLLILNVWKLKSRKTRIEQTALNKRTWGDFILWYLL